MTLLFSVLVAVNMREVVILMHRLMLLQPNHPGMLYLFPSQHTQSSRCSTRVTVTASRTLRISIYDLVRIPKLKDDLHHCRWCTTRQPSLRLTNQSRKRRAEADQKYRTPKSIRCQLRTSQNQETGSQNQTRPIHVEVHASSIVRKELAADDPVSYTHAIHEHMAITQLAPAICRSNTGQDAC